MQFRGNSSSMWIRRQLPFEKGEETRSGRLTREGKKKRLPTGGGEQTCSDHEQALSLLSQARIILSFPFHEGIKTYKKRCSGRSCSVGRAEHRTSPERVLPKPHVFIILSNVRPGVRLRAGMGVRVVSPS